MKSLIQEILDIIKKSEGKLKPRLIIIIVLGTIIESLSIGLIVPAVLLLSKGTNAYTKPVFNLFKNLTGIRYYWTFVLTALFFLVLCYLFKTLFIALVNSKQNKFIFELEVKISENLFKRYLEQPYAFHLQKNSVQLTKNIYNEVKQLCNTINQLLTLFSETLVLLLLSIILFYFQPEATLAAIVFLGLTVTAFIRFIRKKIKSWGADRQKYDAERVTVLANALQNIKDIKLYGRYNQFYADYHQKNTPGAHASMSYANYQKLPSLWLEFIAVFSLVTLVGVMRYHGNTLVSIMPLLSLFAAAMFRFLPSLNRISSAYQTIKFYMPLINIMHQEICTTAVTSNPVENYNQTVAFSDTIAIKNITFSYESSPKPVFTGVSLTIRKGDYVGLIGPSGSGKSTLIDIIIGLLTPQGGKIEVDGRDIQANLRNWQDQIGYVSQAINLMDDTIENNIAFGIPHKYIDTALLKKAIEDAQLEDFINSLPNGLKTLVGEKGVRLSGGQRQRIGIARALYHNPDILVLDEATSSLDSKTEAEIIKCISLLKAKKTILFITHKSSLLKNCDCVYEMKNALISRIETPKKLEVY